MVPGVGGAHDFTKVWLTICAEDWGTSVPGEPGCWDGDVIGQRIMHGWGPQGN